MTTQSPEALNSPAETGEALVGPAPAPSLAPLAGLPDPWLSKTPGQPRRDALVEQLAGALAALDAPRPTLAETLAAPPLVPAPLPPWPVATARNTLPLVVAPIRPPATRMQLPALPPLPPPVAEEDEPITLPTAWRARGEASGAAGSRRQIRAAMLGFGTGLVLVIPAVIYLASHGEAVPERSERQPPPRVVASAAAPVVEMVKVAPVELTARAEARPPVAEPPAPPVQPVAAPPSPPPLDPTAEALATGEQLVSAGRITEARETLARTAASGSAEAQFRLAETFDPNMLAVWGVRDHKADPATARALYGMAAAAGLSKARQRIEALE
jgi:hypothetical protein